MKSDPTNTDRSHDDQQDGKQLVLVEYEESLRRLDGDKELFIEFIDIFLTDSPKLVADIYSAFEASDAPALRMSAHALMGLISNFGAKPCYDLVLALEVAGLEQRLSEVKDQLPRFRDLYEKLCAELISISS